VAIGINPWLTPQYFSGNPVDYWALNPEYAPYITSTGGGLGEGSAEQFSFDDIAYNAFQQQQQQQLAVLEQLVLLILYLDRGLVRIILQDR
jgi:hypothetical protein